MANIQIRFAIVTVRQMGRNYEYITRLQRNRHFFNIVAADPTFHDIDFISWAEASKLNISEESKDKNLEKTNAIKEKKDNKKESTIEKLNKLKDKVAKDSGDKLQDKLGDKKKDREI